jgi:hypothetical protein
VYEADCAPAFYDTIHYWIRLRTSKLDTRLVLLGDTDHELLTWPGPLTGYRHPDPQHLLHAQFLTAQKGCGVLIITSPIESRILVTLLVRLSFISDYSIATSLA